VRDAVMVQAIRTPIGKRGGALSGIHPVDLSAAVLNASRCE
jgi:acetyl-CoA acyltransferase